MADLERRSSHPPRRAREQRAYRLVQVGGGAGVVAVAGIVLAAVGVIGAGVPLAAMLVAVICLVLFRRATA